MQRISIPLLLGAALGATGCGYTLDMASTYDAERAAVTIPYTGVREEVRLYPDYGPIGASILTDAPDEAEGSRPSKKGKPR